MWGSDLSFGFVTNYLSTVFLHRNFIDGKPMLFVSDPIPHTAKSIVSPSSSAPGQRSTPQVSLRECMLFLVGVSALNWQFPPQQKGDLSSWIKVVPSKDGRRSDAKGKAFRFGKDHRPPAAGTSRHPFSQEPGQVRRWRAEQRQASQSPATDTLRDDTFTREPAHVRRQRAEQAKQRQVPIRSSSASDTSQTTSFRNRKPPHVLRLEKQAKEAEEAERSKQAAASLQAIQGARAAMNNAALYQQYSQAGMEQYYQDRKPKKKFWDSLADLL